jgi:FkbM family methyltransferase
MFGSLAWKMSRVVARSGGPFSRLLYSAATIYVRSYKNLDYDMTSNGEFRLLNRLGKLDTKTIFDVGANKGDYTQACLSSFPNAFVHAFEIAPATFKKLQANLSSSGRVRLNEFGLSDRSGTFDINYNPEHDGSSSLLSGVTAIHDSVWQKVPVRVTTGDDYVRDNLIPLIDLLKIDVEGAENLVLEGFRNTLAKGGVSSVQFEFGLANIYSKFLLNDFWNLLGGHGFVLGPIMPDGVEFKDYDPCDEDFQGTPNFFAVHKDRSDMISAVRRQ